MRRLYRIRVLADAAFGSTEFISGVRPLGFHAVVGIRWGRRLQDNCRVDQVRQRGACIQLSDLEEAVSLSWVWLKRAGQWVQRFVISTQKMTGRAIARCGKRRWRIEGFFRGCYELCRESGDGATEQNADEGQEVEPGQGVGQPFVITSQAAEATGPREGAFHHPSARKQHEAFLRLR